MALPAGNYTLTVSGSGQTAGTYAFQLSDLAAATPLTPGTPVSGTLSPANGTDLYRFNATAGQPFYFARLAGSFGDDWRLIDPYGNLVFTSNLGSEPGRLTLASGGTYTLLVEGAVSDTVAVGYSFNVAPITDSTQPLVIGSLVNATLALPGEQRQVHLQLAAKSLLYFDKV